MVGNEAVLRRGCCRSTRGGKSGADRTPKENPAQPRALNEVERRYPDTQYHAIDTGDNTPARYAEDGRRWLDLGAQIVGGCCATTPDHIAALAPIVKGR